MPNTTSKENVALTGTEVSDVPFISLKDASPRRKSIKEYQSGLKKTAALSKDRDLHARLSSF